MSDQHLGGWGKKSRIELAQRRRANFQIAWVWGPEFTPMKRDKKIARERINPTVRPRAEFRSQSFTSYSWFWPCAGHAPNVFACLHRVLSQLILLWEVAGPQPGEKKEGGKVPLPTWKNKNEGKRFWWSRIPQNADPR